MRPSLTRRVERILKKIVVSPAQTAKSAASKRVSWGQFVTPTITVEVQDFPTLCSVFFLR
jgi:hypothetical protein